MANPVFDAATTLLTQASTALTNAGRTVPGLTYITIGDPVDDCESLIVSVNNIRRGPPDVEELLVRPGRVLERSTELTVWLWRDCWPTAVDATEIQTAAQALIEDAYALFNGLIAAQVAGSLFSTCQDAVISPALPLTPSGTHGGWRVDVATTI